MAALSSDQSRYTYADNNSGRPSTPTKRERPVAGVPAPLENSVPPTDIPSSTAGLNDPESRYIVDSRTGRVVGIDGSAGARREEMEEQRLLESAPRAVAVRTPAPEVRVASAVTEVSQPIFHDVPNVSTVSADPQSLPVRRALPVTAEMANQEPRNFNVAEYMAGDRSHRVMPARPVNPGSVQATRTARVYRLSDGSQVVATD